MLLYPAMPSLQNQSDHGTACSQTRPEHKAQTRQRRIHYTVAAVHLPMMQRDITSDDALGKYTSFSDQRCHRIFADLLAGHRVSFENGTVISMSCISASELAHIVEVHSAHG